MATIQFEVTLPGRTTNAPAVNSWTYHHVLPWRYYWLAGYIVGVLIRYKIASEDWVESLNEHTLKDPLKAEHDSTRTGKKDDEKTRKSLFGGDYKSFSVAESPFELLKMCDEMHYPGSTHVMTGGASGGGTMDFEAIANLCTCPLFGGFAGMNGSQQRTDDPGDQCEPRRPHSHDAAWWTEVTTLKNCLGRICDKISAVPEDRKLPVKIKQNDSTIMIATLRSLIADYKTAIPPFNPADWDYKINKGARIAWTLVTGIPVAVAQGSQIADVFSLNDDGQGGGTVTNLNVGTVPRPTYKVRRSHPLSDLLHFYQ